MKDKIKTRILEVTGASALVEGQRLQELWSGYGSIRRFGLVGAEAESIIVKHIRLGADSGHPRGWNTSRSHERKLKSYQVESCWYQKWSQRCGAKCYVPKCYAVEAEAEEVYIVLEDLDAAGFSERRSAASAAEIKACLKWLAHFHAEFVGEAPEGLWEVGTYWHLATRPDELNALKDAALKKAARAIDERLNQARHKTFVHGDAKIENFCFQKKGSRVAAVDFQYVGGGCGMKDVAYFIGSCLHEDECEKQVPGLLDYYFQVLGAALGSKERAIDFAELETEWRELFPLAWADFHRFIKGWSPGHWKINGYSERVTREVINSSGI